MDKYEYAAVSQFETVNEMGKEGWRVVPGITLGNLDGSLLMERRIREPGPETETIQERIDRIQCGRTKAGGWGSIGSSCTLEKDHDGPHSWVAS